jgi:hypothetical protein
MIIGLHDNGPPDISPIGCSGAGVCGDMQSVRSAEGEGVSVNGDKESKEERVGDDGSVEKVPSQQNFPSTPSKDVHMQVSVLVTGKITFNNTYSIFFSLSPACPQSVVWESAQCQPTCCISSLHSFITMAMTPHL